MTMMTRTIRLHNLKPVVKHTPFAHGLKTAEQIRAEKVEEGFRIIWRQQVDALRALDRPRPYTADDLREAAAMFAEPAPISGGAPTEVWERLAEEFEENDTLEMMAREACAIDCNERGLDGNDGHGGFGHPASEEW